MYIQHKEYLALLDQIEYLKKDSLLLRQENVILTEELIKQREKRLHLEENHAKNMKLIEELHSKTISHQVDNTKHIMQKMSQIDNVRKQFLENKFTSLENSSLTQLKDMEVKNMKTKLDFHELSDFANKIRKLYRQTQGIQSMKGRKQISLLELLKWIKSIPGVALNLHKAGLTPSMSSSNMKKKTQQGQRLKQNVNILNSTLSKSKLLVSETN